MSRRKTFSSNRGWVEGKHFQVIEVWQKENIFNNQGWVEGFFFSSYQGLVEGKHFRVIGGG